MMVNLDINDEIQTERNEYNSMRVWLFENMLSYTVYWNSNDRHVPTSLILQDEKDVVVFKLRWGHLCL